MHFIVFDHQMDIYIGVVAVIFTGLGIWLALKLRKPKVQTVVIEKEIFTARTDFSINHNEVSS